MKIVDIIREVSKLNPTEKQRILNHFKVLLKLLNDSHEQILKIFAIESCLFPVREINISIRTRKFST